MKKHLFISFMLALFMLVLVGCNKFGAPTDLKVENDKISFKASGDSFLCEAKKEGSSSIIAPVNNGDSIDVLGLGLGEYELKVKAIKDGEESDWSTGVKVVRNKLSSPQNVELSNNKLYFDLVLDAEIYYAVFNKDGKEQKFEVTSGVVLSNLGLGEGSYEVYVVSALRNNNDATSNPSAKFNFTSNMQKLMVPTGLEIDDGFVFFNVMATTNNYVLKFENETQIIERDVQSGGCEIRELLIPEGTYKVSIKAKGDGVVYGDSDYSAPIDYIKETTYMTLKEKDLINGGYIKWMGRTYYNETKKVNEVYHSASGFELFVKGSMASAVITATNYNSSTLRPCIVVVVDDNFDNLKTVFLDKATQEVELMTGNSDVLEHKIDLYKRSESIDSHIAIESVKTDGLFIQKIENKKLKMEFIAASSSTGYGNLGSPKSSSKTTENSDCLKGFAFLTAQALDADVNIFSASGWGCAFSKWTTPNTASVADEYRNVDFKSSIKWNHGLYVPDVVVVNLGTNDWSYINAATSDAEVDARTTTFQQKYIQFLKYLHDLYPEAQIVVLYGLMNESNIYEITETIVAMAKLAIPNLVSIKINGDAQGYNSHPSVQSHAAIAKTLTEFIKETLNLE